MSSAVTECVQWEAPIAAVRPRIEGVMRRRFGSVELDLRDDGHQIVATIVPMTVDRAKLVLDRFPDDVVTLDMLAPFPVRVDRRTAEVLPDVVPLPPGAWPLVAGLAVRHEARDAVIVSVDGSTARLADRPCAALDETYSPLLPALLFGAVLCAAAVAALARRRGRT